MNFGRLFWTNLILADSLFFKIFFFLLIWADGALKWAKSKKNDIYWGGAVHTWRFTWQTFSPEKRHVRRQFEVFSMPANELSAKIFD